MNGVRSTGAPLMLKVHTSPTRKMIGGGDFSPVTSTLIYGEVEAVLVDTQFIEADVDTLASMIENTGRRLTKIFITHGHADHYFGGERLLSRFSDAEIVAHPDVVEYIEANIAREKAVFPKMMADPVAMPTSAPTPLTDDEIVLEGRPLRIINVGQGDIESSTVLHSPELDAIITGDVVYNRVHMMLGLTGPAEWEKWIKSIERVSSLTPAVVVAGHKAPNALDSEAGRMLSESRSYIEDFTSTSRDASSAAEIVAFMSSRYPHHVNMTTLQYSAAMAMKRRR